MFGPIEPPVQDLAYRSAYARILCIDSTVEAGEVATEDPVQGSEASAGRPERGKQLCQVETFLATWRPAGGVIRVVQYEYLWPLTFRDVGVLLVGVPAMGTAFCTVPP
jgi:hypothetical protein